VAAASPAQRTLLSLLQLALGSAAAARAVLGRALADAGRDDLPLSGTDIIAFVRAHLLAALIGEMGPRLTMAFLDDLIAELGVPASVAAQPSVPPASVPRPVEAGRRTAQHANRPLGVVLVDADRIGRTVLARALVRQRWEVTVIDAPREVGSALGGSAIDVALVDTAHPASREIVELLARASPDLAVVARCTEASTVRAVLARLGVERVELRSREATPEELVNAVRRITTE
jgi:hypothetical protein